MRFKVKKKVGILTFHYAYNYGAFLQCYALFNALKDMGFEPEVIDYREPYITKAYSMFPKLKFGVKWFIKEFVAFLLYGTKTKNKRIAMKKELEKIKLTHRVYNAGDIKSLNFDAIITGSDQVWNPKIVGSISDIYTLNFNTNAKKLSYGASAGSAKFVVDNKEEYIQKLKSLDAISLRETDVANELSMLLGRDVKTVLDPTLLMDSSFWEKACRKNSFNEKYIFSYFIDEDKNLFDITNKLSAESGFKIVNSKLKSNGFINPLGSVYDKGSFDFITAIKNAEYIVTASFHALVFSIIFNKKFFVIPHAETGSRVTTLLETLELTDRICYSINDFNKIGLDAEINWDNINKILIEKRNDSLKWLKAVLQEI